MRSSARRTRSLDRVPRRVAWFLIALCAWTLYVWITRVVIIAGQDQTVGFKVVHDVLAAISIAFGLGAGYVGWRALRSRLRADQPSTRTAASMSAVCSASCTVELPLAGLGLSARATTSTGRPAAISSMRRRAK